VVTRVVQVDAGVVPHAGVAADSVVARGVQVDAAHHAGVAGDCVVARGVQADAVVKTIFNPSALDLRTRHAIEVNPIAVRIVQSVAPYLQVRYEQVLAVRGLEDVGVHVVRQVKQSPCPGADQGGVVVEVYGRANVVRPLPEVDASASRWQVIEGLLDFDLVILAVADEIRIPVAY